MLDLFFGMHFGGWKAYFQFWFWTTIAIYLVIRWMKSQEKQ
jgi:hypothetical protein